MTGLVRRRAKVDYSREMYAPATVRAMSLGVGSAPGMPNSWGSTAVQPMAATRRAKDATKGVMPGISLMTITAGPAPVR